MGQVACRRDQHTGGLAHDGRHMPKWGDAGKQGVTLDTTPYIGLYYFLVCAGIR